MLTLLKFCLVQLKSSHKFPANSQCAHNHSPPFVPRKAPFNQYSQKLKQATNKIQQAVTFAVDDIHTHAYLSGLTGF